MRSPWHSMTPNSLHWEVGTLTEATVTPAPLAMCLASIWRGSIR